MSKEQKVFTIHEHDPNAQKPTGNRKHKWMSALTGQEEYMFQTFNTKEESTKIVAQADRRLKLAGLSSKMLDEKYVGVTDCFLSIADLEGVCLWINKTAQDVFSQGKIMVGRKLREEIVHQNLQNEYLKNRFKTLYEKLPDDMEFEVPLVNELGEWIWKIRYERIDTLKGTPFAYLGIGRIIPLPSENYRKPKNKTQVIFQTFEDHGMHLDEVIKPWMDKREPVMCINLIGRILWMNFAFQDSFHKGEKDLLEIFSPQFGFEAYEKACEFVLSALPTQHEFKTIVFDRMEDSRHKPMGFMVTFTSLNFSMSDKSKKVHCDEILVKVGLSKADLDEQFQWLNQLCSVISLDGRLLYMNDVFRKITGKCDNDLMNFYLKDFKETNPHVRDSIDNIFMHDQPVKYLFVAEVVFKPQTKAKKATFEYERIEMDGYPYAYYSIIDLVI